MMRSFAVGCPPPVADRSDPQRPWLTRVRPLLCRGVPAVAVLCFLVWCITCLRSDFTWDDADSEILNQAWLMARGESIYRDINAPPFVFAIYPPVFFAATAAILKFTGLSFLPARLLSFLAVVFIGWALVRLSRQWNKAGWNGLWAAFFLLLIPAFLYNSARCHVQMMAVAFSLWSLVFFLHNRRLDTTVISPILTVLAIYTKQTQIALPIALVIYLGFRNRKWLWPYVAVLAVSGLAPLVWLQEVTKGHFLLNTLHLAKLSYNALDIVPIFLHHAGPILIFIGLALSLCWRRIRTGDWDALDLYLAAVFAVTLVSLGRVGAHGQYVIELLVVVMAYLLRRTSFPHLHGRESLVSIQILLLFIYTPLFVLWEEGLHDRAANKASARIYGLIKEPPGPILSQQGSFPLFCRGGIYLQLFHFAGLSRTGLWDQRLLLKEIEKRTFPYVITEFPFEQSTGGSDGKERFTPEMLHALRKNYRRMQSVHPYYVYSPQERIAPRHADVGQIGSEQPGIAPIPWQPAPQSASTRH